MNQDHLPQIGATSTMQEGTRRQQDIPRRVRIIGTVLAVTMSMLILSVIVLGAFSLIGVSVSDSSTQRFTLAGDAPRLVIRSSAANIHIAVGAERNITVRSEWYVRALTYDAAHAAIGTMTTQARQDGDTITLTSISTASIAASLVTSRGKDISITVPQQTSLDIHTEAGDVEVRDVASTMHIVSSAGNMTLDGATLMGGSELRSSAGNVECSCTLADSTRLMVTADAGNVRLTLPRETSASLSASTQAGTITIAPNWAIAVSNNAASASAHGDLNPQPTGAITIQTDAGDVSVQSR